MALSDGLEQVFSRVIYTRDYIGVTFRISSPLDYDLVQVVCAFEIAIRRQKWLFANVANVDITHRISWRIWST